MEIDLVRLNFDQKSMYILQTIIALIMYGVALNLKVSDFTNLLKDPKAFLAGLFNHYVFFPALTLGLIYALDMKPSLALGLAVVAACPGGNLANVMTSLSLGNTALSIGLTSVTTLLSMIAMPFYLVFLGDKIPGAQTLLTEIELNAAEIFSGIFLILGAPLVLGMLTSKFFPDFSKKAHVYLGKLSFMFLVVFVIGALVANFQHFLNYIHLIVGIVFIHNMMALIIGTFAAKVVSPRNTDLKAMTLSSGIRNTALGLAIVFQFFEGLGGMALIVAWWGVSQIGLGLILSQIWKIKASKLVAE